MAQKAQRSVRLVLLVFRSLFLQSRLRHRHSFEQTLDNIFGFNSFGFSVKIRENAMPEYRIRQCLYVLDSNVVAAVNKSPCLTSEDQELRRPQACSVIDILPDEIRRVRGTWTACTSQLDGIAHDLFGHRHLAHQTLELQDFRAANGLFELHLA